MLEYGLVTLALLMSPVNSAPSMRNGEDKQCAKDLITWCKLMTYPEPGGGGYRKKATVYDGNVTSHYDCESNSNGTNCVKNGRPWIACSNKKHFSYKGKRITTHLSKNYDREICEAKDTCLNNLFKSNISFGKTPIKEEQMKEMEMTFKQLAIIKQHMDAMGKEFKNNFTSDFL